MLRNNINFEIEILLERERKVRETVQLLGPGSKKKEKKKEQNQACLSKFIVLTRVSPWKDVKNFSGETKLWFNHVITSSYT